MEQSIIDYIKWRGDLTLKQVSFNEIDATYIDDIFKRTYRNQPMWYISYFTETDKDRISNFLNTYHIVQKYYVLFQISDIAI